jgi:hypothetical protein
MIWTLVIAILLVPDAAAAWGPISHLAHGAEILRDLTILGTGLQQLLARHPVEYLYGCVGADITFGKKYTHAMQAHCHSWKVGWQVMRAARTDGERAFAHGYLSHLAADVYSHNHFVPTQLVVSFRARTLRHIYWEARFDSLQDPAIRGLVTDLRGRQFPECDALVRRVVSRTLFSFGTNKRIFDSFLALHDWEHWHRLVRQAGLRSRHRLPDDLVARYNQAIHHAITDLLRRGRQAHCQRLDPTGLEALTLAKNLRRTLKVLLRRGAITTDLQAQIEALNERSDLHAQLAPFGAAAAANALA